MRTDLTRRRLRRYSPRLEPLESRLALSTLDSLTGLPGFPVRVPGGPDCRGVDRSRAADRRPHGDPDRAGDRIGPDGLARRVGDFLQPADQPRHPGPGHRTRGTGWQRGHRPKGGVRARCPRPGSASCGPSSWTGRWDPGSYQVTIVPDSVLADLEGNLLVADGEPLILGDVYDRGHRGRRWADGRPGHHPDHAGTRLDRRDRAGGIGPYLQPADQPQHPGRPPRPRLH